jgi:hypothetical protein
MQFRVESGVRKSCMVFKNEVDFLQIICNVLHLVAFHVFKFINHSISVVALSGIGLEYQGNSMNQGLQHTDVHV